MESTIFIQSTDFGRKISWAGVLCAEFVAFFFSISRFSYLCVLRCVAALVELLVLGRLFTKVALIDIIIWANEQYLNIMICMGSLGFLAKTEIGHWLGKDRAYMRTMHTHKHTRSRSPDWLNLSTFFVQIFFFCCEWACAVGYTREVALSY